jgi:hypothetical protein
MRGQTRNHVPVTITLSPETLHRLDTLAVQHGRSRSGQIAELVREAARANNQKSD